MFEADLYAIPDIIRGSARKGGSTSSDLDVVHQKDGQGSGMLSRKGGKHCGDP